MPWSPRRLAKALCFGSLSLALTAQAQATNVAQGKPSSASSVHANGFPTQFSHAKAFNGIINTEDRWGSSIPPVPWNPEWVEVDLQAVHAITSITVYVSRDATFGRMLDFDVLARPSATVDFQVVPGGAITDNPQTARTLTFTTPVNARHVRLQCKRSTDDNICRVREFQVFGTRLANQPPSAAAGHDAVLLLPNNTVPLRGTASDSDGTIASYRWEQVSGPTTAVITSATSANATASSLAAGVYVFRLVATDNGGATGSDTMRVTVHPTSAAPDARAGRLHVWNRGGTYDSAVFLPKDYGTQPGKKYPAVLSLHGRGGTTLNAAHTEVLANPEGFIRQLTPGKALVDTFPGIVIAPNGPRVGGAIDTWWNADTTHALVQQALTVYDIDPDRVTMTGLSSGASGVNDQLLRYRTTYAGAMPLAYFAPRPTNRCDLESFPLWASGHHSDGTFGAWGWFNPTDGYHPLVRQCPGYSGEVTVTVTLGSGHSGWDDFWSRPEAQSWLVSQHR